MVIKNIDEIKAVLDLLLSKPVPMALFIVWYIDRDAASEGLLKSFIGFHKKVGYDSDDVLKAFWILKPDDITIEQDRDNKINEILS